MLARAARSIDRVLEAAEVLDCRPRGNYQRGYSMLCPAHDDRTPSLSVNYDGNRTLLFCHAGCSTEAVLLGLGLDWTDLFDEDAP